MSYESIRKTERREVGGRTYLRQKKWGWDWLQGKEVQISFGLNKSVIGNYVIMPVELLQPSHIGGAENPEHFIPEAQPRNRATSQSGQVVPELIADNLRPYELLLSGTAYSGAPIINQRGEIIQGNGRGMSLKIYWQKFSNDPAGYKDSIELELACLGVAAKDFRDSKIKQPVVVRMLDISDKEAIELGQFTQSDLEAVANKTTIIKTKANRITDDVKNVMINELLSVDDGQKTLGELIRSSRIYKVLVRKEVIRADEIENYVNQRGEVNADGIKFVSDLLLNLVFAGADVNTPDVFRQLPAMTQAAIEKSTLYLSKIPDNLSINSEVSESILCTREYLQSGYKDITSWTKQVDFFTYQTPAEKYSKLALRLTELYTNARTQKEVVDKFRRYQIEASPKENSLF